MDLTYFLWEVHAYIWNETAAIYWVLSNIFGLFMAFGYMEYIGEHGFKNRFNRMRQLLVYQCDPDFRKLVNIALYIFIFHLRFWITLWFYIFGAIRVVLIFTFVSKQKKGCE